MKKRNILIILSVIIAVVILVVILAKKLGKNWTKVELTDEGKNYIQFWSITEDGLKYSHYSEGAEYVVVDLSSPEHITNPSAEGVVYDGSYTLYPVRKSILSNGVTMKLNPKIDYVNGYYLKLS